ncbi:glycosyltransferase [Methylobacterium planeticum]|uniref:Glycosyltransferase n=1 Tax=Methylobacterium planeticum TaxID=2615211 RepID=A0A6N6MIJ7_9HYPH|nr:glycosyltransferase [Methylobacterium planeticum]
MRAVVGIPVRNEAERIEACLLALQAQQTAPDQAFGVVLFLNNCTDATAAVVARLRPRLTFPLRVVERTFAGAQAGWARRAAMEAAASWLETEAQAEAEPRPASEPAPEPAILTTDADSRVPPHWIARNLAALAAGADAVAGRIALDAEDAARLPDALHARGRLEGAYEALLLELAARLDPDPHDRWPCHGTASGASLCVRLSAYRRAGGMPALPVGEDRAFVARLAAIDARLRHCPDLTVITSGRLDGRAPGGAADTMRLRCTEPASPCDGRLEALPRALFRILWRRRLRGLHGRGALARTILWAPLLGVKRAEAERIGALVSCGAALAAIEAASPRLVDRPLTPAELEPQIRRAGALLALVRTARRLRDGPARIAALRALTRGNPAPGAGTAPSPEGGGIG